ncbi:hypothetical protein SS50377_20891 [Spironucleus salmonicida]|uniref:Uncharacterized protein n=1 Tax=Spironucleus salmonicida TaxID=348837 RepID=A0A9P8S299_9EUKA|nr:hypothetical protein SS50377_20891 [Spironucleus salmonicida]
MENKLKFMNLLHGQSSPIYRQNLLRKQPLYSPDFISITKQVQEKITVKHKQDASISQLKNTRLSNPETVKFDDFYNMLKSSEIQKKKKEKQLRKQRLKQIYYCSSEDYDEPEEQYKEILF